ncbi:prepilin-type N-terminal cleavage/methylation domain-containing protein [Litchfieldella rifensis]|uniref:Prepilin-type N-terminal cleavage/methylation domain-containing protein n=1 Tax=Litchfieldella rifensis TaxID=762643 RepID=A0ABV7LPC2_9GAMM
MTMSAEQELQQAPGAQRGFTLVELMVALVIGLIITLGATQLFIASKRSYDRIESLAQRQEATRFLVSVLSQDIRGARAVIREPADPDQAIEHLDLVFDGREDDVYCSGGQQLSALRYSFSDNILRLDMNCGGEGFTGEPQPLVSGLTAFDAVPDASSLFLDVMLEFEPLGADEPEDRRRITFRVANRTEVVGTFD